MVAPMAAAGAAEAARFAKDNPLPVIIGIGALGAGGYFLFRKLNPFNLAKGAVSTVTKGVKGAAKATTKAVKGTARKTFSLAGKGVKGTKKLGSRATKSAGRLFSRAGKGVVAAATSKQAQTAKKTIIREGKAVTKAVYQKVGSTKVGKKAVTAVKAVAKKAPVKAARKVFSKGASKAKKTFGRLFGR